MELILSNCFFKHVVLFIMNGIVYQRYVGSKSDNCIKVFKQEGLFKLTFLPPSCFYSICFFMEWTCYPQIIRRKTTMWGFVTRKKLFLTLLAGS